MKLLRSLKANQIVLLLINLLLLFIWGFAGIGKVLAGTEIPTWFVDKFQDTFFAKFPGVGLSFWMIAIAETAAFIFALVSLLRLEFLKPRLPFLRATLVLGLAIFLMLEFGLIVSGDGDGQVRLFNYFTLTLLMYAFFDRNEKLDFKVKK